MPSQKFPFVSYLPYHIYNRGFQKQQIFFCEKDYLRFLAGVEVYLAEFSSVQLYAFCLLPNHFHFILSTALEEDREGFMRKVQQSYAMYLKTKYRDEIPRGQVFEGRYNARPIENENYLSRCFTYVSYNAIKHELVTNIVDWPWTSLHQILKLPTDHLEIPRMHHLEGANIVDYVDINEE